MFESLGTVTLKSGEQVEAGFVKGPDAAWSGRIQEMLAHKGQPWDWQIRTLLSGTSGVDAFFYVLHRGGIPFSHILVVEHRGVGLLGHVWTVPSDRGEGAASQLMQRQMEHFSLRGGKALHLGTGYDSSPYHIYRRNGFESVEPNSGVMAWYSASQESFEGEYFAPGKAVVQPMDWPHWATASPLFAGDFPGLVRNAPFKLVGRKLTEGPLLQPLLDNYLCRERAMAPTTVVLQKMDNGAVVGLAGWNEALWPDSYTVDLYCHPNFWSHAPTLFTNLVFPKRGRLIAYADSTFEAKIGLLQTLGFTPVTTLPNWVARDVPGSSFVDVTVWHKPLR